MNFSNKQYSKSRIVFVASPRIGLTSSGRIVLMKPATLSPTNAKIVSLTLLITPVRIPEIDFVINLSSPKMFTAAPVTVLM